MDDLPDSIGQRVYAALHDLALTPRPAGCKRIKGSDDTYRIRVGDYRVLDDLNDQAATIMVLCVLHRKDAYRNL